MKLSKISPNPNNPRVIKDESFQKLKRSIKEFEKMLSLRPIVVDGDGVILGGNQRYEAMRDLGYEDIPDEWVRYADDLTAKERERFIIADNIDFGGWDYDSLANEWDTEDLVQWGFDEGQLTGFDIPDDGIGDTAEAQEKEPIECPNCKHLFYDK